MEAIYYWTGGVVVWGMGIGIGVTFLLLAVALIITQHKDLMEKHRWYRRAIDLQLLPLYVRFALADSAVADVFFTSINKKQYRNDAHLRVLIGFLNQLYTLRKP